MTIKSKIGLSKNLSISLKAIFFVSFLVVIVLGVYAPRLQEKVRAETMEQKEARLRAELQQVEKEIAEQQKILSNKQRESVSIERDIAILNAQISEAKLQIKARNITIERLSKDINIKSATIGTLSQKIEDGKGSLSQLLRKTNEIDNISMVSVVLDDREVSEIFRDLDAFDTVKKSLHLLMSEVAEARDLTEAEKQTLSQKRTLEDNARREIELQKKKIEQKEAEKQRLLSLSKSEERNYENVIKEREKKAAVIRSALFALRDTSAIPFGTALQYANEAYKKTGVRPAFLLAILTQETNLGENVGSCYLTNAVTGEGKRISTGAVMAKTMSPTRDVSPFLEIMKDLGRDPFTTRVSCPWQVGWGGAMGPSQFIPSTWTLYVSRIKALVSGTPDPWNPAHAFVASSLFLKDLGADEGVYASEREAALRYYAGGNWNHPRNAFYGNEVMAKASDIQTNMIDPLQNF
ncbi:MAG: lytic murein transglycosylase [Patescibacteria group bacterium]